MGQNRTKIVCTLGPESNSEDTLSAMIEAGMNVARINLSHGEHHEHARTIKLVRRLATEQGEVVAVMADLQGPKIRIGKISNEPMMLHEGSEFVLTSDESAEGDNVIYVPHEEIIADLQVGKDVFIDDGLLRLEVFRKEDGKVHTRVLVGGPLVSNKGISVPGVALSVEAIPAKDRADVKFAIEQQVDYIAMSFVRSADDLHELRQLIESLNGNIPIIAKIERREALDQINEVVEASDGVMVARGDLGVELPVEEVPVYQKQIIRICNHAGRPVITATQMLSSMTLNPRPTRAESSDVYNAIMDGTDAVMLSNETAVGAYPVRSVETMARIAHIAERHFPYDTWEVEMDDEHAHTIPEAIGSGTCRIAAEVGAKAIITSTNSGYTARQVAKHRPRTPIVCTTHNLKTRQRMALVWGLQPLLVPEYGHTDEMLAQTVHSVLEAGYIEKGDLVVITAGIPVGQGGHTNLLKVHQAGADD